MLIGDEFKIIFCQRGGEYLSAPKLSPERHDNFLYQFKTYIIKGKPM